MQRAGALRYTGLRAPARCPTALQETTSRGRRLKLTVVRKNRAGSAPRSGGEVQRSSYDALIELYYVYRCNVLHPRCSRLKLPIQAKIGFDMARRIPTTIKDQELVAQRRAEIIDVATRLFLERGFHKTSIRDIARACPFNLASLYMYVSSKEDILFLVAQHLIDEKAKAMSAVKILEDDPVQSFRMALTAYCRIVHRYRQHIRLLYRELEILSPERRELVMASLFTVTNVFEQIVREGIRKRVFAQVDPKLVALNALFLCHLWALHTRALRSITQSIEEFRSCRLVSCSKESHRARAASPVRTLEGCSVAWLQLPS